MRLSASRIRSISLRIARAEGSAFAGFGRRCSRSAQRSQTKCHCQPGVHIQRDGSCESHSRVAPTRPESTGERA